MGETRSPSLGSLTSEPDCPTLRCHFPVQHTSWCPSRSAPASLGTGGGGGAGCLQVGQQPMLVPTYHVLGTSHALSQLLL